MSQVADTIQRCLHGTDYMCLATVDMTVPWASPVYFAFDQELNLYFMSVSSSRHMQNIIANNQVSVAIYSTAQDTQSDVIGLQLSGNAQILSQEQEIASAFETYFARVASKEYVKYGDKIYSPYAYHSDWKFVKINITDLWLFDSQNFGDQRQHLQLADILPLQKL